ncbi:MAG: S41 family peptidase, partial [Patescibacteria group bacterium]|nr:S41 family peptidase [Patescibacteria group bacterium]
CCFLPIIFGYIKVSTFYNNTVALNFASSIDILMRYKLKGLVIDLRGNSGGYLNQLIAMLDLLLPPGTILFGMTSKNESQIITTDSAEYYGQKATKTTNTFNIPIAVLTDGGSASASEVFASAIKEHLRGITVGEKTAGALEVALTFPLPDDAAMEVTTFFITMPMADGQFKPIEKVGVSPTIPIKLSGADFSKGKDDQLDAAIDYLENLNKNNVKK